MSARSEIAATSWHIYSGPLQNQNNKKLALWIRAPVSQLLRDRMTRFFNAVEIKGSDLLCLAKNAVELGATDRADALSHATTRV